LSQHQQVFGMILPGRPLDRGFEHTIEMEEGAKTHDYEKEKRKEKKKEKRKEKKRGHKRIAIKSHMK
jgi:hypothetical protein